MTWWLFLLLMLYTIACVFLIFVILIQSGKGGGLSSLAGASQGLSEAFGTTSSERTMTRLTSGAAILFLVLAILISLAGSSIARQRTASPLGDATMAPSATPAIPGSPGAGAPGVPAVPPTAQPAGSPAAATVPAGAQIVGTPIIITVTPAATPAAATAPAGAARGAAPTPGAPSPVGR